MFSKSQKKSGKAGDKVRLKKFIAVLFWLLVWSILSLLIAEPVLLPSPLAVLKEFLIRSVTREFWLAAFITFSRIVLGFLIAFIFGNLLALLASFKTIVRALLWPPVAVMKSTPVASIILLLLIWFRPATLPLIIAILLVFPIVYTNTLESMIAVDRNLLEMAECFDFSFKKKLKGIYIPALRPALLASAKLGTTNSFKAAVAAEVIAVPLRSFGSLIYEAKIHLDSAGMFAVTAAVVLLGGLMEMIFSRGLDSLLAGLEKPGKARAFSPMRDKSDVAENPQSEKGMLDLSPMRAKSEADGQDGLLHSPLPAPSISFENVTFSYESAERAILNQFNYEFKAGEKTLISGASGSGKTTLLRLILGKIAPSQGRISPVIEQCSVVFQDDRLLLHLSAEENLAFVSEDLEKNLSILTELELAGKTNMPVENLSGGEKRRVAIARALAYEAPLLILDEPLRSLDPALAERVAAVIGERSAGRTVIETGHKKAAASAPANQLVLG